MKSKRAKEILNRSYDGGHVCFENAESAVEIAESERDAKAVEAHRSTCQYLFNDNPDLPLCVITGDMMDCDCNCEFMRSFIKKLNEE